MYFKKLQIILFKFLYQTSSYYLYPLEKKKKKILLVIMISLKLVVEVEHLPNFSTCAL